MQLRVVVRVDVDEAGRDDEAVGVELARAGPLHVADLDDRAVAHADVGGARGRARPVDDGATADDEVELGHCQPPPFVDGWGRP